MKAIRTRYLGPGNVRGSRYSASDGDGNSLWVGTDHSLNSEENHRAAKDALCTRLNWDGSKMQFGVFKNDYYWVFTS